MRRGGPVGTGRWRADGEGGTGSVSGPVLRGYRVKSSAGSPGMIRSAFS